MSLKNRDEHNRWRNKTVAFRVSPEEDKQIETYVRLSGLTKQQKTKTIHCSAKYLVTNKLMICLDKQGISKVKSVTTHAQDK